MDNASLWLGVALALAGVAVLRLSWARPVRATALNGAGWALIGVATVLGAVANGAWGVSVIALAAMAMASAILTHAAFEQPRVRRQPAPTPPGPPAPVTLDRIGAGLTTFCIAGPLALAAGLALALATRTLLLMAGGSEADANVAVLGLVPLAWPIIAFAVLMNDRRIRQFAWLAAIALPCLAIVLTGGNAA